MYFYLKYLTLIYTSLYIATYFTKYLVEKQTIIVTKHSSHYTHVMLEIITQQRPFVFLKWDHIQIYTQI